MPDNLLAAIVAALFGLLIGSFLNVCIFRWPRDLSVVKPRSFCPHCEKQIAAYDNIPVVSYLLLGGKCRHCKARIPWRYPFVELAVAAVFFFGVYVLGPTAVALKFCIFGAIQVALIFTDLEERILPDELTLGGMIAGFIFAIFVPIRSDFLEYFFPHLGPQTTSVIVSALGAAVPSLSLWGFAKIYEMVRHKEGLGFGDVKMIAMIGAFFGLQGALTTLVLGCLLGSVIGMVFILAARKEASTYELPLGTFLAFAALVFAVINGPLGALHRGA